MQLMEREVVGDWRLHGSSSRGISQKASVGRLGGQKVVLEEICCFAIEGEGSDEEKRGGARALKRKRSGTERLKGKGPGKDARRERLRQPGAGNSYYLCAFQMGTGGTRDFPSS